MSSSHQAFFILSMVQCQSAKFCALCGLPGSAQPVCVLLLRHYSSVPDLMAEPNHNSTVFRMPIRCLGTWWRCGVPALLLRDFELDIGLRSLEPFKDCFDPVFMFRLHQDGAEAGHRFRIAGAFQTGAAPKAARKLGNRQMQIMLRCGGQNLP